MTQTKRRHSTVRTHRITHSLAALSAAAAILLGAQPQAQAQAQGSHCQTGEFVLLNANMGRFDKSKQLVKNGKTLSLCADAAEEPFGRVAYRFGPIGKVEMEQLATPGAPFGMHFKAEMKSGANLVFFSKGNFTYYVTEATGMGSGVSLLVFQGNKQIVDQFSGNDADTDFQSNTQELDFDRPRSPVFMRKAPKHPF